MKKIIVALLFISLAGVYSCSKNDPGIQPPSTFGEVTTPTATILLGKSTFAVGDQVSFSSTGANIGSYTWDFGDGSSPGTGSAPTHTYLKAGVYTVKLTVLSADKGHSYVATALVVVGTIYWDSTVLVRIAQTDSMGNGWRKDLSFPTVGFNFMLDGSGVNQITTEFFWKQVNPQNTNQHLSYTDNTTAHVLTPTLWDFNLDIAQNDNPISGISHMYGWVRDISHISANPMVMRGTALQPFIIKVYWSVH